MNRSVVAGIVTLFVVAIARLVVTTQTAIDDDVQAYVNGLNYDFSALVDSIELTHVDKGVGFLVCKVETGRFDFSVEDDLAKNLKEHKRLRVIFPLSDSTFKVFLGGIKKFEPCDSVIVNSRLDRFAVFRCNKSIWESKVSRTTVSKVSFAFWLPD